MREGLLGDRPPFVEDRPLRGGVVRRVLALEIQRAHEAPAHLERIRFRGESGATGVDREIDRAGKSAPARRALGAKRPEPVDVGGLRSRLGSGEETREDEKAGEAAHDLHYTGAPLARRHTHESRGAAVADQPPKPESQPPSLQFSIDDSVANGVYVNFANIIHNPAEFVLDFGRSRAGPQRRPRPVARPHDSGPRQAAPQRPRPERGSLREDLRRHPHRFRGAAARRHGILSAELTQVRQGNHER